MEVLVTEWPFVAHLALAFLIAACPAARIFDPGTATYIPSSNDDVNRHPVGMEV